MNELDRVFLPLLRSMDVTTARAQAVARNIANANTPGYRRVDVDFSALVENAGKGLREQQLQALADYRPQITEDKTALVGANGNSVDLDHEIIAYHKIKLRHELAAQLAGAKLNSLRRAISGQA